VRPILAGGGQGGARCILWGTSGEGPAVGLPQSAARLPTEVSVMILRILCLVLVALLGGCAGADFSRPGPPHPGAANPYSNGGFHDPGPNYPATGI